MTPPERSTGCQGYTFGMRLNIFMRLTSFLGVFHNLCSEFALDVGRLKEISTTFRNSMKIALNFIVNINQMPNNHERTYFNLIGHFFCKFLAFSKMLARFQISISQQIFN